LDLLATPGRLSITAAALSGIAGAIQGIESAVRILAISGSLRSGSTNTAVLHAAAHLAPGGVEIRVWSGIANLPHFNPDLDRGLTLESVETFREELRAADAVMICSPEYAHGVPGVLKNALDWVVGSGEFIDKPVALINASPCATIAHASLAETLRTMTAAVVPEASVTLPILSGKPTVPEILASPEISAALQVSIEALRDHVRNSTSQPAER
jgi:NAD(P)H-dependent FMN reductase